MPSIKRMQKTMVSIGIPEELRDQMPFGDDKGNRPEPVIALIDQMDALLSHEQCMAIMEREGCCKSGQRDRDCRAFGKKHAGKTLAEKIERIANVPYMMRPRLNEDGTLTVTYSGHQNGVHTGKTTCSCGTIRKLKQPFTVSKTYCGCCAGHFLYHYQNALGVKLHLREIVSSSLDTHGEAPCSFTFTVEDPKSR